MRAIPLLLGCLFGLGAIANATAAGSAAAGSMGSSSASSYNCTHRSSDHGASHETSSTSGDVFNIPRGASGSSNSPANMRGPSSSNAADDVPTHMDGGDSSSNGSHSSGLGWQSLLPGSIQ